jgi:membrane-associated phospholipid phosphatase
VLAVAGVWCFALTQLGQLVLAEARPIEGGAMHWLARGGHGVSGHASAAGMLYSPIRRVLARDLRAADRQLVTAALAAWAVIIAWSRMWMGMHYLWNVMLGLALGFFTGSSVVRVHLQGMRGGSREVEGPP